MKRKLFIGACGCFGGAAALAFGENFGITFLCVVGLLMLYAYAEMQP